MSAPAPADARLVDVTPQQEVEIRRFAQAFLGFGELTAPYWFIGTEPGLSKRQAFMDGLRVWTDAGGPVTICNRRHHIESGFTKWHQPQPPLQPTWRQLMLALCVFLGEYQDNEQSLAWRRGYQERRLGCAGDETAVLEIGALNAAGRAHWPYVNLGDPDLNDRDRYIAAFLKDRAHQVARLARRYAPAFVWMYGAKKKYQDFWNIIGGHPWKTYDELPGVLYRREDATLYVVTDHVTYRRRSSNAYWIQFGQFLRSAMTNRE